jgi:hypothetical protein
MPQDAGAALYGPATPGLEDPEDWEQGLISIRKLLKFDTKFLPDTPRARYRRITSNIAFEGNSDASLTSIGPEKDASATV